MLRYSSFSYVKECLQAGIKIYFYNNRMLHAKCVIVDDEFVTTGSTNFDYRSFEHNFECNVLDYSKPPQGTFVYRRFSFTVPKSGLGAHHHVALEAPQVEPEGPRVALAAARPHFVNIHSAQS